MHNCKSGSYNLRGPRGYKIHNQVSDKFISLRPDIAIVGPNKNIDVLELKICHETNVSRNYKETRYSNLHQDLKPEYSNYNLNKFTVEVTTLGLITDFFKVCVNNMKSLLADPLKNEIMRSTVSSSFQIYCNRHNVLNLFFILSRSAQHTRAKTHCVHHTKKSVYTNQ